ncbi:MAG: GTPase ObgE [Candidatus Omnitrophota bacterium]
MFIDRVKTIVKGGTGGKGCNSYYSDKFTRHKRPDGGDGGNGGSVILKASRNVFTLLDFKYRHEFMAANGKHGSSKKQRGKNGSDIVILVPLGTQILEEASNCLLDDLRFDDQQLVIARGGRGGWGNHVKKEAISGQLGEIKNIVLDLKLIADVGIVGFPNAGKSTLISKLSSAKPRIASYPFTTKEPALGVVNTDKGGFTMVDIPGLIKGAHSGRGLGDKFLRHVERTRILVHLIDMAGIDGRDPFKDYESLNKELEFYSREVAKKLQIIVANKIDLEEAKNNLAKFKKKFKKDIIEISAKENINFDSLINEISKKLQENSR